MVSLHALIPALQLAIGPVILISGVGLLLLSMTNRLGRTVDRSRDLARECRAAASSERECAVAQLAILMRRARIMRAAIASASLGVLFAAVLIVALFAGAILQPALIAPLVAALFVACVGSVITALLFFLSDINLGLRALRLEVEASLTSSGSPGAP